MTSCDGNQDFGKHTSDFYEVCERSTLQRAVGSVFGYDFFISYTRRDSGRHYAKALARRLEADGFEVFFDSDDYAAGDDWKTEGSWALRRTSQLIVVGSPEALSASAVVHEVKIYSNLPNRRIIPIDFDGTIRARDLTKPIFHYLKPEILFLEDSLENLENGPSDEVLQGLRHGFDQKRQHQKRSRVFAITALVLATLLICALIAARVAIVQRSEAIDQSIRASRQQATANWQVAVIARDRDLNKVKATHNFLLAATALDNANDYRQSNNMLLAAQASGASIVNSFPHDVSVQGGSFTLDGKHVLTWGGNQVRLWDALTAELVRTFSLDSTVNDVRISRRGNLLLTCARDARLWDITTGQQVRTFEDSGSVVGATFNADESRLLTWSTDWSATVWDIGTELPLRRFTVGDMVQNGIFSADDSRILVWTNGGIHSLEIESGDSLDILGHTADALFSLDKLKVLSADFDVARITDVTINKVLAEFPHGDIIQGVLFTPDESCVLTWSRNANNAKLWEASSGNLIQTFRHQDINAAAFDQDGSRLLTWGGVISSRGDVKLWDVEKSEPINALQHNDYVDGAIFSSTGDFALAWDVKGLIQLWHLKNNTVQGFHHEGAIHGAVFAPGETLVLSWSDDHIARLLDLRSSRLAARTFAHKDRITRAAFDPNDSDVITHGSDGEMHIWDAQNARPLMSIKHAGSLEGAAFDLSRSRAVTWGGTIALLWDLKSSKLLQRFEDEEGIQGASISRDGSRVLTRGGNHARLWSVETSRPIQTFQHSYVVSGAVFSDSESQVLTWSWDGTTKLWDVNLSDPVQTIRHEGVVNGAVFSRDGTRILSWACSRFKTGISDAKLWDVTNSFLIQSFEHKGDIVGACFSVDESLVITWSDDGCAKLWHVGSKDPIRVFPHAGPVKRAFFSKDESRIITHDGLTVFVWSTENDVPLNSLHHTESIVDVLFLSDEKRVLTWTAGVGHGEAALWDLAKSDRLQIFRHDFAVDGATLSRDEARLFTWNSRGAWLWDLTRAEPLRDFRHDLDLNGMMLNLDESRLLTWSDDKTAKLWDVKVPDKVLMNTEQRTLEFIVRSATRLDASGTVRPLSYDEWQQKKTELKIALGKIEKRSTKLTHTTSR